MSPYPHIVVIYNPHSTGAGKALAEQFMMQLHERLPKQTATLLPTRYAAHAEKIAYNAAMNTPGCLVITASGDGGYHEIVNGVLRAVKEGAVATTGIIPAGNANDHYHALHGRDIVARITDHDEMLIDVLKLTTKRNKQRLERYAHSYIGIGLSPKVGRELNKTRLSLLKEGLITLKVLRRARPTRIQLDGREQAFDSLVCTNIQRMSKYFQVAKGAKPDDGVFEISSFRRRNQLDLMVWLLHAFVRGLTSIEQVTEFTFTTIRPTLLQLDGEVITADAQAVVRISIEPHRLRCII